MAYKQPCSPFKLTEGLTKKEKRAIRRSQRQNKSSEVTDSLYKAGIVGIGPSTPAIGVEDSPAPPGTGTGYSIGNKAVASVAPMPGTMGDGITLIPEPKTPPNIGKKKDLDVKESKRGKKRGRSKIKSKFLKTGLFGRVKFKKQ